MPFVSVGNRQNRKCKYCDNLAKINYYGIKRRHKGYLRTCGLKECLRKQYDDKTVNRKKAYISRNILKKCDHCDMQFLKTNHTSRWCSVCVPDNASRAIMQRYNLSHSEYLDLIKSTGGICPICQDNAPTVIDHCHKTNNVRGFICQHCNISLALIENKKSLDRALKYLEVNSNSI